jgi:hypothetical protein
MYVSQSVFFEHARVADDRGRTTFDSTPSSVTQCRSLSRCYITRILRHCVEAPHVCGEPDEGHNKLQLMVHPQKKSHILRPLYIESETSKNEKKRNLGNITKRHHWQVKPFRRFDLTKPFRRFGLAKPFRRFDLAWIASRFFSCTFGPKHLTQKKKKKETNKQKQLHHRRCR